MPASQVCLARTDAAELAEALGFVSRWLTGVDHAQLAASFGRFVGHDGYPLAALRQDLDRFVFLLGSSDGEDLFGTTES